MVPIPWLSVVGGGFAGSRRLTFDGVHHIWRRPGTPDAASCCAGLADSEQPEKVLVVDDSEIKVEKWISPAEIKAREEEERLQRAQAAGDDTADRALNQMMGGSLAGASAIGKLDQVMVKPDHLIPAEGEELLEEQAKELKEWEAQYKAFIADQEAYARTLDLEAKKLKSDMLEECNGFDGGEASWMGG